MLENVLYLLSECSLISGALLLMFSAMFTDLSQRFCFSVAKSTVVLSALFAVLFYNKSFLEEYFVVSSGTTLVFVLTCGLTLVWLFWASKWFGIHKDYAANRFCICALMLLLSLKMISQTTHFGILFAFICLMLLLHGVLFLTSRQSEELYHTGRKYFWISALFIGLLIVVLILLKNESWQYEALGDYLGQAPKNIQVFSSAAIFCVLLFLLGAAPFQFWRSDRIAPLILPVAMYFEIVPILALWTLFWKLNVSLFSGLGERLQNIYLMFGMLSVVFGIIGANASCFARKIFASVSLYQTGVLLLVFSTLKANIFPACLIYTELYLYVLLGIYICFYAIKSGGEYANNLSAFKGLVSIRPYVGGALVFLVIVLIGLPPFTLFLSEFMMLITVAKYPLVVYAALIGLVMLVPVCLKIVQTVCFLPREKNFDRPDFTTYVSLIVYFALFILMSVKPQYILLQETVLSGGM